MSNFTKLVGSVALAILVMVGILGTYNQELMGQVITFEGKLLGLTQQIKSSNNVSLGSQNQLALAVVSPGVCIGPNGVRVEVAGVIITSGNCQAYGGTMTSSPIKIGYPNGGEVMNKSSNIPIFYTTPSSVAKVSFSLSKNGYVTGWIAQNVPSNGYSGYYSWSSTSSLLKTANGSGYKVSVRGYNKSGALVGTDISDNSFSIVQPLLQAKANALFANPTYTASSEINRHRVASFVLSTNMPSGAMSLFTFRLEPVVSRSVMDNFTLMGSLASSFSLRATIPNGTSSIYAWTNQAVDRYSVTVSSTVIDIYADIKKGVKYAGPAVKLKECYGWAYTNNGGYEWTTCKPVSGIMPVQGQIVTVK
ncbi:MAG: hypothetical protein AAB691_00900 [Patescibacteria group bacterium]